MVLDESFHWGLDNGANGDAQLAGGLGEDILLQQCDRAHEVAGQLLVVGVTGNVAHKEIGERAHHDSLDRWLVDVVLKEWGKLSQESVGGRLAIHAVDNGVAVEVVLLEELLAQVSSCATYGCCSYRLTPPCGYGH